ncbi:hypothetical protein [Krasilnikovia sp. MM14-A1259]|uniref:hypothetical protein n=1 Tax=Krasilnikovia sp. MM14-A1259 TaxID=3373539 RepID=UPI00381EC636
MTLAFTGRRWSEIVGLSPTCIRDDAIDVHWKLYELNGRFYRGRPKDGSMRTVVVPPFLPELLATHLSSGSPVRCNCSARTDDEAIAWCTGVSYAFLGSRAGHFRRSNYSDRAFRPAADGWYPQRSPARPSMPVLVDLQQSWPGRPLPSWPAARPGQPYVPPQGRGRPKVSDQHRLACWTPILTGLTPHGLRHGYQTWMDEAGYVLQSHQMGHEVPGMRGRLQSRDVTDARRSASRAAGAVGGRAAGAAALAPRSSVGLLDAALAPFRGAESGSVRSAAPKWLPKSGT